MKYLVANEGQLTARLSALLIPELERYDIRAEIISTDTRGSQLRKLLKQIAPDLFIVFGTSRSLNKLRLADRLGLKSCFFYQSILEKNKRKSIANSSIKISPDLPNTTISTKHSFLLSDLIKSESLTQISESSKHKIAILFSSEDQIKGAEKLKEKLKKSLSNIEFEPFNIASSALSGVFDASAAIALDQLANAVSVYCNVPVINAYKKSLINFPNNQVSIVNTLSKSEVVKNISQSKIKEIQTELNRILNDHQYSAGILDKFQSLKSEIGMQPFAREVAQEIVDWLDENN